MSSHQLTVDTIDAGTRRALDLFALDRVRIQAYDRILFVQCGDGWIVEEAWRRIVRTYVCGLDMSATHVELASRLRSVPGKLEFKAWDGRCLPVPDGGFDHVVATFPLVQVQGPAALFREVRRVLRAEGDVYLLHSVSCDTDLRHALTQAGFAEVQELARSDDQMAILVHARVALPAVSATPAHSDAHAPREARRPG